jgi:hypothetical protein
MAVTTPTPGVGYQGSVDLNGFPLQLKPGSYQRAPAPRFGQKVSTGDLRYQDFNPYESATSIASLENGYGLRRYSDLLPSDPAPQTYYKESSNVDAREAGIVISPHLATVTLPGSTATPVWMGEWTPSAGAVTGNHWVIVAGTKVYYLSAIGTAVDSTYALPATAVQGDVVVVGGELLIGYGAAHTAQYITTLDASTPLANVTDTAGVSLFAFALTGDRSAIYLAGGTSATAHVNVVISASTSATTPATAFAPNQGSNYIYCGSTDSPITGLAPGGGIQLVFVGKYTELGAIDGNSVSYHTLVRFNGNRQSTNCVGMDWWLGGGFVSDPAGPMVIVFPRGRSLWAYAPNSFDAGTPLNIAPWGKNGFRPTNARGIVTARTTRSGSTAPTVAPPWA